MAAEVLSVATPNALPPLLSQSTLAGKTQLLAS